MNNNKTYLCGEIISQPVFSHEVYGEGFYETFISVSRLSDQRDILPITISERLIESHNLKVGMKIALFGQFRSYNKFVDGKSKLMLTVFVRDILELDEGRNPNKIYLCGYVCKLPIYRTTPFSREICDMLLAVNRAYNKSDYIPSICWGRNARFAKSIAVGEKVAITGRIQSREYQKKISESITENKIAYEISVSKIAVGENCDAQIDDIELPESFTLSPNFLNPDYGDIQDVIKA